MKLLQYHRVYHLGAISNISLDKRRKFFIHWPLRLCLTNSESNKPNQFHLPSFKFYFFCSVYFDSIVTCLSRKEWKVLENKVASQWQIVSSTNWIKMPIVSTLTISYYNYVFTSLNVIMNKCTYKSHEWVCTWNAIFASYSISTYLRTPKLETLDRNIQWFLPKFLDAESNV